MSTASDPTRPAVLAATDLTARSANVAGRAARLARHLGARLVLAHVGSHGASPGATGTGDKPGTAEPFALPTRLGGLGRGLRPNDSAVVEALNAAAAEVGAEPRPLTGDPAIALTDLARNCGAVLIVLGLHRERRVLDLLRLTTMERIVLRAPCPVLIAHQPVGRDYAQVLAPTDFSEASAAALTMAAQIAPTARFHAVHALQLPLGAIFRRGQGDSDAALAAAETRRDGFLAMPGLPTLDEAPEIVPGGVHEVLDFRREELAADLVAIGAHSGREPDALGNYARDLMRAPPTDLLVAKPAPH